MPGEYYILRDKTPVIITDIMEWGRWMENGNRRVKEDWLGDIHISTVFLGLDHNWGHGNPLLFETMIFGGDLDENTWRYSTWDEAEAGHVGAVAEVRRSIMKVVGK